MNKKQKLATAIGAIFLIPMFVVLLFSAANYISAKGQERVTVSKAMGGELKPGHTEINDWSFQERTEYFKNLSADEIELLGALQNKVNRAMAWISVMGVLIFFVAGFVGLAIFLAGVPRVR